MAYALNYTLFFIPSYDNPFFLFLVATIFLFSPPQTYTHLFLVTPILGLFDLIPSYGNVGYTKKHESTVCACSAPAARI